MTTKPKSVGEASPRITARAPVLRAGPLVIAGYSPKQLATLKGGVKLASTTGYDVDRAKAGLDAAKDKQGAALDALVAGMACAELLAHRFAYDVRDNKGDVIDGTQTASLYMYMRGAGFSVDGKASRARQTGFRVPVLAYVGARAGDNLESIWKLLGRAGKVASRLVECGISAALVEGKLTLTGGDGSEEAKKYLAAKSTSAMVALASPSKAPAGAVKQDAAPAAVADAITTLKAALAVLRVAAKGNGSAALSPACLELLPHIAKAIAAVTEAEAKPA